MRLGGFRAGLGGVCRLEVLEQTRNLRQVLQLEWVIVGREMSLFLKPVLGGSNSGHFLKFWGARFQENFPK